jgi:microcystin-dependent protein
MVTLPDVFTFSATVNCAETGEAQYLFVQGLIANTTVPFINICRRVNTSNLLVVASNGTTFIEAFTGTNYFAGLDNTDIKTEVSIDFINKTIKVYRNNVQFGTTASVPTMLKPVTDYIYFGTYVTGINKLLGYMRNICLFDTALTDTQRNWLAQGNTPPILYDVTNWLALETLRYNTNFLLQPYSDGKKLRIANTHTTNTITCTLPSGQTYAGAITSFTLKPYEKIEIELFGTEWDEIGNEGIGTIKATGSTTADFGRLLCHGQALSRTTYARLFNRIGTAFGAGNGSTTFNLPDCREVALVGAGTNVLNASAIVTHNALTAGQFQDDQFEEHSHYASTGDRSDNSSGYFLYNGSGSLQTTSNHSLRSGGGIDKYNESSTKTPNFGNTTHGKQLAVNWQIKY